MGITRRKFLQEIGGLATASFFPEPYRSATGTLEIYDGKPPSPLSFPQRENLLLSGELGRYDGITFIESASRRPIQWIIA